MIWIILLGYVLPMLFILQSLFSSEISLTLEGVVLITLVAICPVFNFLASIMFLWED